MNRPQTHRAPRSRRARDPAGYTFLDLALVALVVGILAAVGVPMTQSALVEFRLEAAADEVITALEYAQMTALSSGCQTRVSFDVPADTVLVERARTTLRIADAPDAEIDAALIETTTFEPLENPLSRGSDYLLSLAGRGWSGSVDLSRVVLGSNTWVVFDPRGGPSSGGTVQIESEGRTLIMVLDKETGRVTFP